MSYKYKEYGTFVKLLKYLRDDKDVVDIPAEINGKPVTRIGDYCFYDHSEIKLVNFPSCIERIGNSSFELCGGLKKIVLPESVTHIGVNAFRECIGLNKVVLSPNLKVLSQGVFSYCSLKEAEFVVSEGVKEICENAFLHSGHFKLQLPKSVEKIGFGAFCDGPEAITELKQNKKWYSMWPYGENIRLKYGIYGKVIDYSVLSNDCGILSVSVEDDVVQVFFPAIEKEYYFVDEQSQARMEEFLVDGQVKSYFEAWIAGLLEYESFYQQDEFKNSNQGEIVLFGKELDLFMFILAREKLYEKVLSDAYDWALERQREYGIMATCVQLEFKTGDTIDDGDGFIIALFYKKSTGEALLYREWEDRMMVAFNVLANYDEVAKIAPKSLNRMLHNGLKIKQRWEDRYL